MADPPSDEELRRMLLAAAIGLLAFLAAGVLFAQGLPSGTKLEPREAIARSQAAVGNKLGDYALRDQRGNEVRLAQYRGKPLLVSFVYTACFTVCPVTTRALARAIEEAQRVLRSDAF